MINKEFRRPNLNAPRYRPTKLNLTNNDFYQEFISANPKYKSLSAEKFKSIIKTFNGKIWENVVSYRDGVELPEQLGYLFIGTCPRKTQKENIDFAKSMELGVKVTNKNWESDNYLAKIFYTNYETKYSFRNHEMWGFTAVRDFKRTVAKTYPKEWKKYLIIDNLFRISKLFRRQKIDILKKEETEDLLVYYDEFNLKDPYGSIYHQRCSIESS